MVLYEYKSLCLCLYQGYLGFFCLTFWTMLNRDWTGNIFTHSYMKLWKWWKSGTVCSWPAWKRPWQKWNLTYTGSPDWTQVWYAKEGKVMSGAWREQRCRQRLADIQVHSWANLNRLAFTSIQSFQLLKSSSNLNKHLKNGLGAVLKYSSCALTTMLFLLELSSSSSLIVPSSLQYSFPYHTRSSALARIAS